MIGNRMKKNYEEIWKISLPWRMPVIVRLDGRAFHTLTKGMDKPFDEVFIDTMADTAEYLCKNISTTQFAYVQSDEISLLLHPYKKLDSEPWFGNEIQKMCSISSALASTRFSNRIGKVIQFDSRVFVLPEDEVVNYFIWRQQDASRNSVSMLANSMFSHKELMHKSNSEKQDMMMEKEVNWNDLETYKKRGLCVVKKDGYWKWDKEIPLFTADRDYVQKYLTKEEE